MAVKEFEYPDRRLTEAVYRCAAALADWYGGTIVKLILGELRPLGCIPPHEDVAPVLRRSHRCHVPLITHSAVHFIVDRERQSLRCGMAYELDNTREHSVTNAEATRRVHLICDVMHARMMSANPSSPLLLRETPTRCDEKA